MNRSRRRFSRLSVAPVNIRPERPARFYRSRISRIFQIDGAPPCRRSRRLLARLEIEEQQAFYMLLEDAVIQDFLIMDETYHLSDKHLLAMVLCYFRRTALPPEEYTRMDFFIALFVANQTVNEANLHRYWILPYALGWNWRALLNSFMGLCDGFRNRLQGRAAVNLEALEKVMATDPQHAAWQRERPTVNGQEVPFIGGPRSLVACGSGDMVDSACFEDPFEFAQHI